jgi:hypothetical protein
MILHSLHADIMLSLVIGQKQTHKGKDYSEDYSELSAGFQDM